MTVMKSKQALVVINTLDAVARVAGIADAVVAAHHVDACRVFMAGVVFRQNTFILVNAPVDRHSVRL
jgi:hypothetical protein